MTKTETHIVQALGAMLSGKPFLGPWRCGEVVPLGHGLGVRFSDGQGRTLAIDIMQESPARDRSRVAAQSLQIHVRDSDITQDMRRIIKAVSGMLALDQAAESSGARDEFNPDSPDFDTLRVMDLCISNNCQNKCLFCSFVRGGIENPTADQVRRRLQEYREQGYGGIEFSSKEFLLRGDAVEILEHARDLGFPMIHVVTNGLALSDEKFLDRVLGSGVNKLTISLHSHKPDIEERITGRPGGFEKKVRAIENVISRLSTSAPGNNPVFSVNTVITPLTAQQLDQVIHFIGSLGVKRHNVFFPRIHPHMMENFEETVPRFAEITAPLQRGIAESRTRHAAVSVIDVPLCVLPRNADFIFRRIRKDILTTRDRPDLEQVSYDVVKEKVKGPPCRSCAMAASCEGVFERYVERRGWDEFRPM